MTTKHPTEILDLFKDKFKTNKDFKIKHYHIEKDYRLLIFYYLDTDTELSVWKYTHRTGETAPTTFDLMITRYDPRLYHTLVENINYNKDSARIEQLIDEIINFIKTENLMDIIEK